MAQKGKYLKRSTSSSSGTDVMISLKNRQKNRQKIGVLTQNKAKIYQNLFITLVFEKTPIFSPTVGKNRRSVKACTKDFICNEIIPFNHDS
jgi:hypothetical protein